MSAVVPEWERIILAMRNYSLVPSTAAKTLVCVDIYQSSDFSGVVHNLFMPQPVAFTSAYQIIYIMEAFFDEIGFPQAYFQDRTFNAPKAKAARSKQPESEVHQYMSDEIFATERGKKATFVVQVQFRQNSTWQGTITWTEEKKTQRFRSTLEMIKLMDSALSADGEDVDIITWE